MVAQDGKRGETEVEEFLHGGRETIPLLHRRDLPPKAEFALSDGATQPLREVQRAILRTSPNAPPRTCL